MEILFDIILAVIIMYGLTVGFKNGFVKTISKPIKPVAALAIAVIAARPVSGFTFNPLLKKLIGAPINDFFVKKCSEITAGVTDNIPTAIKFFGSLAGVDVEKLVAEATQDSVIQSIVDSLTTPIISTIAVMVTFVVVFFLAKLLIAIFFALVDAIANIGVLSIVNSTLGLVFGGVFSLAVAWALVLVTNFVLGFDAFSSVEWVKDFNGGPTYNLIREFSPINLLLSF